MGCAKQSTSTRCRKSNLNASFRFTTTRRDQTANKSLFCPADDKTCSGTLHKMETYINWRSKCRSETSGHMSIVRASKSECLRLRTERLKRGTSPAFFALNIPMSSNGHWRFQSQARTFFADVFCFLLVCLSNCFVLPPLFLNYVGVIYAPSKGTCKGSLLGTHVCHEDMLGIFPRN